MRPKLASHLGPVLLITLLTALVFWPGLKGPWVLDDEPNIFKNPQILLDDLTQEQLKIAATAPLASYPYARGLAFVSFALNYYHSGLKFIPYHFKLTNLVIHCVNASLIYFILFGVFSATLKNPAYKPRTLALIITLCWACHPIQVSSVLYAVQRMTLGSATAVLIGCLAFVKFRTSPRYLVSQLRETKLFFFVILLCLVIGFHFKENVVLLPLFLLSLEIAIRGQQKPNPAFDRFMLGAVIAMALISVAYIALTVGDIRSGYIHRNYTLEERLLTQPRVLFWYLKLILFPQLTDFSLFLDAFPISISFTQPISTSISIIAWIALLITSLLWKTRGLLIACLVWFLGGHLIESSFLPLEIAFEHRNYLPSIAPLAMLVIGIQYFLTKQRLRSPINYLLLILPVAIVVPLCFILSTYWGDKVMFITQQLDSQPYSARANGAAGLFYSVREPLRAIDHFEVAGQHNPTEMLPVYSKYSILMTIYNLYDLSEQAQPSNNGDITKAVRTRWSKPALALELASLERRIEKNLKTHAISAQTMASLEKATYCALANFQACRSPETVLNWVDLALANDRKLDHYTPLLQFHKARLLASTGEVENALKLMEKTIRDHPSSDFYKLKLAELYEALGMDDEFNILLQQIPPDLIKKYRTKL